MHFSYPIFRYVIPSRSTLVDKLIPDRRNKITHQLKEVMQNCDYITLSMAMWTHKKMTCFLGITAHFVKDWELKTCALACKYVC